MDALQKLSQPTAAAANEPMTPPKLGLLGPETPRAMSSPCVIPNSPLSRLAVVEQAVGVPVSAAGMMDRLDVLEQSVFNSYFEPAVTLPERIQDLENSMGL